MSDETTELTTGEASAPVAKRGRPAKAGPKAVTPGRGSTEWWYGLAGIALGSLMCIAGAAIPGAQALIVPGGLVISAGIAGYQISRGIAKK